MGPRALRPNQGKLWLVARSLAGRLVEFTRPMDIACFNGGGRYRPRGIYAKLRKEMTCLIKSEIILKCWWKKERFFLMRSAWVSIGCYLCVCVVVLCRNMLRL